MNQVIGQCLSKTSCAELMSDFGNVWTKVLRFTEGRVPLKSEKTRIQWLCSQLNNTLT